MLIFLYISIWNRLTQCFLRALRSENIFLTVPDRICKRE